MASTSAGRIPDWLKFLGGLATILLIPTMGFIYSQGESSNAREQLAASNIELNATIKELTTEINSLSMKLNAEMVKIDYNEKRLSKLEDTVISNSNSIATMKFSRGGNG